jgi:SAM-dependent methyltransferase
VDLQAEMKLPFELESLQAAKNYRQWLMDSVQPYLGNRILELGAGIGNMSELLPRRERLILSELDDGLFDYLKKNTSTGKSTELSFKKIDLNQDWAQELNGENLDTIVSFNVLEHISDDTKVIQEMASVLRESRAPGKKRIIAVVPAHSWAFGELDRSFGHFRRYSRARWKTLAASTPDFKLHTQYLNLFGLPGWLLMGQALKKTSFGLNSIRSFELLCPLLRPIDDALHNVLRLPLGQSIIAVLTF